MLYNQLGKSGIKVSELSFGSYLTFSEKLDLSNVKSCMRIAFDNGINSFDTAESYNEGIAEVLMGRAAKHFRREDIIISTKIFFGEHINTGPNDTGLSRKHLVEGIKNSLKRLDMDYVDILYCHRSDPNTPIEETIIAMDYIIRSGLAFYWGTSEWSSNELEEAFLLCNKYNCIPPITEQPHYNILNRNRVENEYNILFKKYNLGLITCAPLSYGILTGKYNKGIPDGSRFQRHNWTKKLLTENTLKKVRNIKQIAKEINCSLSQFSLAWCLKNHQVNSIIIGASSIEQLKENIYSIEVKKKLTKDILNKVDNLLLD